MRSVLFFAFFAVCLLRPPDSAHGQAFCSLRDPNRYIKEFFPKSTSYKSFVRHVTPEIAKKIQTRSGVNFDPREFGNHTLYAAFEKSRLVGLLQAHSEVVDWGVAEVVWSTDSDMNLKGFRFQRCRSPHKSQVLGEEVKNVFQGWSEDKLKERSKDIDGIIREVGLKPGSRKLLEGVVNGALKMLAMVDTIWSEDVATLRKAPLISPDRSE
jgi:hypothetical protein